MIIGANVRHAPHSAVPAGLVQRQTCVPPTLKRWAIVGRSLRDNCTPDPILRQSSAPTARDRARFFACFGRGCRQIPVVDKKQVVIADVLPTHTPELFRAAVQRAAELLRAGEAVALPTETVYGLAANALNAQAVERIFQIKGRPTHNPIIVHVASMAMADRKSTRLNSSHLGISYAVFCLKKK